MAQGTPAAWAGLNLARGNLQVLWDHGAVWQMGRLGPIVPKASFSDVPEQKSSTDPLLPWMLVSWSRHCQFIVCLSLCMSVHEVGCLHFPQEPISRSGCHFSGKRVSPKRVNEKHSQHGLEFGKVWTSEVGAWCLVPGAWLFGSLPRWLCVWTLVI